MHGKELLDELVRLRGVAFISDLHAFAWTEEVLQAVQAIPESKFPLKQWNDALCYLFDCHQPCRSVADAKAQFISLARRCSM